MTHDISCPRPLRLVTFNLLNDLTYWPERAPLVESELRALAPDVIALQEVSLPLDNATWLAERLGGYAVHLCPGTGRRSGREAVAMLSRLPVEDHAVIGFGHQGRVAQRVVVRHGAVRWTVVNSHLHWSLWDDRTRRAQIRRLMDWLPEGEPAVACGDFNALPHFRAVAAMRERFASAQAAHFGHEAHPTFPTPLKRGPGLRHSARRVGMRVAGPLLLGTSDAWRGTLDYIFVDPMVRVKHCEIVLQRPAPHDPDLFPSDHVGLMAELTLHDPVGRAKLDP